jgi:SAM-dependent methyltransferase
MRNAMPHSNANPANLVKEFLPLIEARMTGNKVLDLACGSGRNGLFLTRHNIPVVFADNNPSALENVVTSESYNDEIANTWLVDFENGSKSPLLGKKFDVVLVFNYLHRPAIDEIKASVVAGGLILYETFTSEQARIGRPSNPDFLLNKSELKNWFKDWQVLHYFEGKADDPQRFYASVVAVKPDIS